MFILYSCSYYHYLRHNSGTLFYDAHIIYEMCDEKTTNEQMRDTNYYGHQRKLVCKKIMVLYNIFVVVNGIFVLFLVRRRRRRRGVCVYR